MRNVLISILGVLLVVALLAGVVRANPIFNTTQPVAGYTVNRWSYMTAWNLSTGALSLSPSWYNGRNVWNHPVTSKQQWIARFVYDQSLGQTRELAWYYTQDHVQ